MTDKYYRLVTILVNICPDPLREIFLKYAAADQNLQTPYSTLDAYLAFRKKDIMKLKQKKLLRKDQINMLFPPQGQGQADINTWDLTLLSLMITEIFEQQLQPTELTHMNDIRGIRNTLQHISGTGQITEKEFVNMYQQLQLNSVQLALSAKGQVYADKIKQDIEIAANSVLADLGDVLRQWYVAEISELKDDIEQLKDKIDEINQGMGETRKTLKKTTVKRKRSGGKLTKRFKTVDHILENMRGSFMSLMKNESEVDFQIPPEAARITNELEDSHIVVVSGYGKGLYLQTALSAIENREYDYDRCVLVSTPSDWRHISGEDVDLVVFHNPFGKKQFDNDKAKSMYAILDSISSSVSENDEDELFDVVMITDQSLLDEFKKRFSHDLIENPIIVFKPTTEDSPVDLVEGESALYQVGTDQHYNNLLVQSVAYCKHHRMQLVNKDLKEEALEVFRCKKVIVISGPRSSGKTTLALSLLSSYQEGHYLILTEPDDLRYIRFGVTCVIVIEDLGGKYTFDMTVVKKWFRMFDMLYSAVKDGKLNVIITCVPEKLNEYIVDTSKHPMLDAVLTLPKNGVVQIKQEPSSDAHDQLAAMNVSKSERNQLTPAFTRIKNTTSIDIDNHDYYSPLRFCQHPDGSFLFLQKEQNEDDDVILVIFHFGSDFRYICKYKTDKTFDPFESSYDICCTDSGDLVLAADDEITLYRITNRTIQNIKSTKLHDTIRCVSFLMSRLYVFCGYGFITCYVMDTKLNIKKTVQLYQGQTPEDDDVTEMIPVVPCVMQKYFFVDDGYNIITCDDPKKKQIQYLREEGFEPRCICAASEDSVFVLGIQGPDDWRILQVNTDMEIISDIPLKECKGLGYIYRETKMVFDKLNSRLVLQSPCRLAKNIIVQIYLE